MGMHYVLSFPPIHMYKLLCVIIVLLSSISTEFQLLLCTSPCLDNCSSYHQWYSICFCNMCECVSIHTKRNGYLSNKASPTETITTTKWLRNRWPHLHPYFPDIHHFILIPTASRMNQSAVSFAALAAARTYFSLVPLISYNCAADFGNPCFTFCFSLLAICTTCTVLWTCMYVCTYI